MFIQISTTSAGYPRGTFFTAPHSAARDSSISFAARGLLMYVLSRGDGWRLTAWEMKAQGMGRTAFDSAVRELEQAGYLAREQQRDPRTGQWLPAMWRLTMRDNIPAIARNPHTENPNAANPNADAPHSVNEQESVNQESANPLSENQVKENQSSESAHAPTDDDDSAFSLPADFGKLTQEQRTELQAEVTRLGAERVSAVVERVQQQDSVRRKLPYLLTALKNESESTGTSTPPSSAPPPPKPDSFTDAEWGAMWLELLAEHAAAKTPWRSDAVEYALWRLEARGFISSDWALATPSPDVDETPTLSGDSIVFEDAPMVAGVGS